MNIFVAGGAGFIGSHLCRKLASAGHRIVVGDNLLLGRREFVAELEVSGTLTFHRIDVSDMAAVDALFARERFDAVFHLAANSDVARSHFDPTLDYQHTLSTTYALLEGMRRHGIGQLLFASTSAVYGEATGKLREDDGPLLPISHYGAAKLASEAFIASYAANYGLKAWIARFPNVVGERMTHGAIFDFVHKLRATPQRLEVLGDGNQAKPYLHADDLVDAMLLAWRRMDARVNLFNVGGDARISVRTIAEIVADAFGGDPEIAYLGGDRGWIGDVPNVDFDVARIAALGWQPQYDPESAVRIAARWMVAEGL